MTNEETRKIFEYLTKLGNDYTINGWRTTNKTLIVDAVEHGSRNDENVQINVPLVDVYGEKPKSVQEKLNQKDLPELWEIRDCLKGYEFIKEVMDLYGVKNYDQFKEQVEKAIVVVQDLEVEKMLKQRIEDDEAWEESLYKTGAKQRPVKE